jgi:hypothetical protein
LLGLQPPFETMRAIAILRELCVLSFLRDPKVNSLEVN